MNDYSKIYKHPNDMKMSEPTPAFSTSQPVKPNPPAPKEDLGIINAREVYIRKGPGKEFEPVGTVKKGDQVIVLNRENNFLKIETNDGVTAYIVESFVTVD